MNDALHMRLTDAIDHAIRKGEIATYDDVSDTVARVMREAPAPITPFQRNVKNWCESTFGSTITADRVERIQRFLEEALELAQAEGMPKADAAKLLEYVWSRPPGEILQEVGGVMVTLAAYCNAVEYNIFAAGTAELERCWTQSEKIREKQKAKPQGSPLPKMPSETLIRVGPYEVHGVLVCKSCGAVRPDAHESTCSWYYGVPNPAEA